MPSNLQVIVTCEHGGNHIPKAYVSLFAQQQELMQTHKVFDPGALSLARILAKKIHAPLFFSKISRLLIDLNRSLHHPNLFSALSKSCSPEKKQTIIQQYYTPYRETVTKAIQDSIQLNNKVIHISVHSFTPVLNGQVRNADIGLLYDPQRPEETLFCKEWKQSITAIAPNLRVRMNYPYRGSADGFCTALRKSWGQDDYVGIELEINQNQLLASTSCTHIARPLSGYLEQRKTGS
jgi:predicted N-formylglutamate amidohydrolase